MTESGILVSPFSPEQARRAAYVRWGFAAEPAREMQRELDELRKVSAMSISPGTERDIQKFVRSIAPQFIKQLEKLTKELKRFNDIAEAHVLREKEEEAGEQDD